MVTGHLIKMKGRPRAKQRHRTGRNRRGILVHYKETEEKVAEIKVAALWIMSHGPKYLCPVSVSINAAFAIPKAWSKKKKKRALGGEVLYTRRPDIDNIVKFYLDALNGYAYKDDSCVAIIDAGKFYAPEAYVEIKIEPLNH